MRGYNFLFGSKQCCSANSHGAFVVVADKCKPCLPDAKSPFFHAACFLPKLLLSWSQNDDAQNERHRCKSAQQTYGSFFSLSCVPELAKPVTLVPSLNLILLQQELTWNGRSPMAMLFPQKQYVFSQLNCQPGRIALWTWDVVWAIQLCWSRRSTHLLMWGSSSLLNSWSISLHHGTDLGPLLTDDPSVWTTSAADEVSFGWRQWVVLTCASKWSFAHAAFFRNLLSVWHAFLTSQLE